MPKGRLGNTFANFDRTLNVGMNDAYEQCKKVAAGEAWCALLSGGYGTGKSHLAVAAMREWGWNNSWFWKVPDFLDWVKTVAYGQEIGLLQTLAPYGQGNFLLVLDDLGVENPTDWANEQLYRVLDSRYDEQLPTIITTNQPLDRIDGRIRSRYRDGLVVCRGRDLRADGR